MTDCKTVTLNVEIPEATHKMLLAYAETRNSPLGNAVSAALQDGIEATCLLHPQFRAKAGLPEPHLGATCCRLIAVERERCAKLAEQGADPYRTAFIESHPAIPLDCTTTNGALHYGRAQGMEMAAEAIRR